MNTEAVINKVYYLISNESVLNGEVLLNLVKSISKALSAEQRGSTLSVLREIVEKWQKETKGVVPFELEATFELVVKSVLEGSLKVPAVSTRCLEQFGWFLCRRVAAVVPGAVEDISGAVVVASAVVAPVVVAPVVVAPVVAPVVAAPVADDVSVSSVLDAVIEEIAVSVSATAATETVPLKPLVKEVVPEQVQPVVNLPTRKASNKLSMKSERRG
jgi:hypothetical protein